MLGSFEEEPIIPGPVDWPTELSIISVKPKGKENVLIGIESWTEGFDSLAYSYSFLSMLLFTSWFMVSLAIWEYCKGEMKDARRGRRQRQEWIGFTNTRMALVKGFRMFPILFSHTFLSLLGVHLYQTPTLTTKILATFFVTAVFNLVNGYFLNLVSVDMVAVPPISFIDTLDDLLNKKEFSSMRVMTSGGLWHESALKGAVEGSPENRLANRMQQKDYVETAFTSRVMDEATGYVAPFLNRELAIVFDRAMLPLYKSIMVQMIPDSDPDRMHISRDWFGERLLAPMISKSSDTTLVDWIGYKYRQLYQSWIIHTFARDLIREGRIDGGVASDHKILQAIGGERDDDKNPPDPFNYLFFKPFFILCLFIFSIAFLTLIIEVILKPSRLQALIGTLQAPVGTLQAPVGTRKAPVGTFQAPIGTRQQNLAEVRKDKSALSCRQSQISKAP